MTQDPGDPGNASENPLRSAAPKNDDFEIRLIRSLVVSGDLPIREKLIHLSRMRGHDVASLDSLDLDEEFGGEPVDLLLAHLPSREIAPTEQLVRRLLRLFRDQGIVVLGAPDPGCDESQLAHWLNVGVTEFIWPGSSTSDSHLLAAEHRIGRNRARMESQKQITASLKRYEILYLNSPDAHLIVTPRDNRILDTSLQVKAVLGWRRDELKGRYLSLVFPNLFRKDDLLKAGEEAVRLGKPVTVSNMPFRFPDGTQRVLDARVAPVPWESDEAISVTFQDVTVTRARNERRLRSAKLDTVSCMATGVADDVSNLLTAVRGNLSLIGKQPTLGRDARELLHDAESACNSADKLVGRLRTLSRSSIHSSAPDLAIIESRLRRRTALGSFLERLVSFELLGSQIQPTYEVESALWDVEVNEDQIEQALQAVVANAKDAMPSGGQLRILATNYEPPSNNQGKPTSYVLISIVDDGHGVPKEYLSKVFDPYFSTRSDHAGLGLALSQAIIRAHGGIIDVERAPVRGTVIRIYLPAVAAESEPDDAAEGSGPLAVGTGEPADTIRRKRVLVMDDDKDIRIITKKILESHGFDVYCTQDGREAIEVFAKAHQMQSPFDVALFDLDVRGGMGGKDAVARLRRDYPDIKVILMTGFIDDILLETHQEHGFSGVITKPFQIDKLVATITQFAEVRTRSA